MKRFLMNIPKVLFAVLCYLFSLMLAILSAYFTVNFYSEGQADMNKMAMGGLAIMLEIIKITLAISYPFMQYRDLKREKKVMFYLRICFLLSIMASMNFFLSGGEIERSPASKISELIYSYVPMFNIIPLEFTKFLTTMSLSILVEYFIVFLPILAPIMFLKKDKNRLNEVSVDTKSRWGKLKAITISVPDRIINNLYKKVVGEDEEIKVVEVDEKNEINSNKPKLKLLKSTNLIEFDKNSNADLEKHTEDNKGSNMQNKSKEVSNLFPEKDTENKKLSNSLIDENNFIDEDLEKDTRIKIKSKSLIDENNFVNADLEKGRENKSSSNEEKRIKNTSSLFQTKVTKDYEQTQVKSSDTEIEDIKNTDLEKETDNSKNSNSLITENDNSNFVQDKGTDNNVENLLKTDTAEIESGQNFFQDKRTENSKNEYNKEILKAIYKLSENDTCPSVKSLVDYTGINKNIICEVKKEFEKANIIRTDGLKTTILSTYQEALKSIE